MTEASETLQRLWQLDAPCQHEERVALLGKTHQLPSAQESP
jgi:hypothetical protein